MNAVGGFRRLAASAAVRRIVGLVAILASVAILIASAVGTTFDIAFDRLAPAAPVLLLGLSVVYAAALGLLAIAWRWSFADREPLNLPATIAVYGASILPKYLPGTIFQYVSRQALGARFGWSGRAMAKASAIEIGIHVLAPVLLLAGLGATGLLVLPERWVMPAVVILLAIALTVAIMIGWRGFSGRIGGAMLLQFVFFSVTLLVAACCAAIVGIDRPLGAGAMFLLAWLIGFAVPGVPGGVGVRESALLLLLAPIALPAESLLLAALSRIVTLAGDLFLASTALLVRRRILAAN